MKIGIDLVSVQRIKQLMEKRDKFLTRFFTEAEGRIFEERGMNPKTVAANFAAKEAFVKALGTGFRHFGLQDIEVLRDELGAPYLRLSEKVQGQHQEIIKKEIACSLSHDGEYAIAMVIIS